MSIEQDAVLVTKALESTSKTDGVHRLRDLEVQEVSLVDRPANQRKFLIVKTEDPMPKGKALKKNEDGELETPPAPAAKDGDGAGDDTSSDDGAGDDTSSGDGDSDGNGDGNGDDTLEDDFSEDIDEAVKSGLTLSATVKGKLSSTLSKCAKRLSSLAQAVENASDGEGDDMPPKLAREIGTIARQLGSLVPSGDDTDKGKDKDKDKGKDKDKEKAEKLAAAYDVVDEMRALQKAGRKISGANMRKLKDALAIIQALAESLDTPPKGVETSKSDDTPEEVAQLTKAVEQLSTIVKQQGATIKKLRGGRPAPNSGTDGEEPPANKKSVSWPADFNASTPEEEDIF